MEQQDWPITGVAVVADIGRCPAGYTTVSLGSLSSSTKIKSKYFVQKKSVIFLSINLNIYFWCSLRPFYLGPTTWGLIEG